MFHFAKSSRGAKSGVIKKGLITLHMRQVMSVENEQSIRVERAVESSLAQKSSVIQMYGKKQDFAAELPMFDAEYHVAGFCSCCMRGE
ncbi:hypothetical protein CJD38_06555 [Stenotrophobium rhamnosiphilum]|uniref:Uncharacterized protein n=1 Tax=Stenotrophobium rhamnosiphilum TaxID=2029166 RepID=A0A2T5MI95_9GAMM|nr:hypothetical protein CJD38_06555 [Stenotrophobium rhamnosiphilum]